MYDVGGTVPPGTRRGDPMLSKWAMNNKLAVRVASSTGAMTALALVVAAPGKWA
jgi:hypothetical protein